MPVTNQTTTTTKKLGLGGDMVVVNLTKMAALMNTVTMAMAMGGGILHMPTHRTFQAAAAAAVTFSYFGDEI